MLHVVAIFIIQRILKEIQNEKLNEIDEQNSEDVDHIDGERTNLEESASVLQ